MKILHITAAYKPALIYGGPTMSVAMLCEQLLQADVMIRVFTTTANGTDELKIETGKAVDVDGIAVHYFKRVTKDHTHLSPALLRALWLQAKDFDVVHIHAWWNLVSLFSCAIALARKVPVVLSPRGMLSSYSFTNRKAGAKSLIHRLFGERLLTKCHVHATSAHEATAIALLVKPKSLTTIPNFVRLQELQDTWNEVSPACLHLLFLSRIEQKKGLDILLDALKTLNLPYHLTIAGDGDEAYLSELKMRSREIAGKITWAGFAGKDKFAIIQSHDLLVLPSHDENFGNVVIESLSKGTAVLISEHVGLADYVNSQELGWICETNTASVARSITNIWQNGKTDLKRIRQIAPGIVRRDFSGASLAGKYIDLYRKIIHS